MDIVSIEFLLFCGLLLYLYYQIPGRFQWVLLLTASWLFYGSQGPENLKYILFTTLSTYGMGLVLDTYRTRFDRKTARKMGKPWLLMCMAANFGILFACKVNLLRGSLLPLGLSFYLFQSIGYLLDVYRGTSSEERNLLKFSLFVSYFPQLIQGPISRVPQLLPQLTEPHTYDGKQVSFGLQRMLWGYFKKLVIAQRMAPAVLALRNSDASLLLLGTLYAIQIYGDFTGGIDIVLGLSEAFGIRLPENFCRPFFAKNTAEFWRRWHITLGEWMKDYVFYPLSVCKPMRTLSISARKHFGRFGKRLPVYVSSLITWSATGIWHGLTPNFLLWGLMNWAVIVISEELTLVYEKFHGRFPWKQHRWYSVFQMLRTFTLMNLIRISDLFPNVEEYFRRLVCFAPVDFGKLGLSGLDWVILAAGCALVFSVSLIQETRGSVRELLWQQKEILRWSLLFGMLLLTLLMGCYGIGYDAGNFIYSQF